MFTPSRSGTILRLLGVCTLGAFLLPMVTGQSTERTVTGMVEDRQHEPLKGAVVQIESETTNSIVSYITDAAGHFSFKRLSSEDDYKVWATYREHRSQTREISHFDSKSDKSVELTIVLD